MSLRRFLNLPPDQAAEAASAVAPRRSNTTDDPDTATVRRIVTELESLPAEQSRYLAAFAYVLSRAAHADLEISAAETQVMEEIVARYGGLPAPQAVLVVEIAKSQARLYSGTEDYLVTRQFRDLATEEQRKALLRCCFLIGAADASISAEENAEISQIATELGFVLAQLNEVRRDFHEQLTVVQQLRARAREAPGQG